MPPISPGSSGGAVLNEKGEVIGISMAIIHGKEKLNQNLNVAVPSNYLTPLIEKAKKPTRASMPLSAKGVTGTHLTWGQNFYEFSIVNSRPEEISVSRCLVIFYGKNREFICADQFNPRHFISAGSANRVRRYGIGSSIDYSPGNPEEDPLYDIWSYFNPSHIKSLVKSYEVRMLHFMILEPIVSHKKNKNLKGVTGGKVIWSEKPPLAERTSYVFSLQNQLGEDVSGVDGIVIFYDNKGEPIHADRYFDVGKIPAGKTGWVNKDMVSSSVKRLTKRVDIKILDFDTVK